MAKDATDAHDRTWGGGCRVRAGDTAPLAHEAGAASALAALPPAPASDQTPASGQAPAVAGTCAAYVEVSGPMRGRGHSGKGHGRVQQCTARGMGVSALMADLGSWRAVVATAMRCARRVVRLERRSARRRSFRAWVRKDTSPFRSPVLAKLDSAHRCA